MGYNIRVYAEREDIGEIEFTGKKLHVPNTMNEMIIHFKDGRKATYGFILVKKAERE